MPPARCAARREHAEAVSSAGDLGLARLGGLGLRDGQREHPVGELAPYRVGVDVAGQVGAELEPAGAARAAVSAAASVLAGSVAMSISFSVLLSRGAPWPGG
jgi:hypothetical protein